MRKKLILAVLSVLLVFQTFSAVCQAEIVPGGVTCPNISAHKKLAEWSFNQSDLSVIKDETGNGFDVKSKTVPACVYGISGSALSLFDQSHLLTVGNSEQDFAIPNFAIEGWINYDKDPSITDDMGGQAKIFDFNKINVGIREGYSFFLQPGGALAISMADKWGSYWNVCSSKSTLLPGHWYHVAGTYDGEKMKVYINGQLAGEKLHQGGYPLPHGNAQIGCQIRNDDSVNSRFFGKMDELGFYNYALSEEELTNIFNASKPEGYDSTKWFDKERGLVAEYFTDLSVTDSVYKEIVPKVDFNWGNKPPVPQITGNSYAVRWTGFIQPVYSGRYNFNLNTDANKDSCCKMWVDNKLIIDGSSNSSIILSAGQCYPIKIEYSHVSGDANISMWWSNYDVSGFVPQDRLLPVLTSSTANQDKNGTGNGLKGEYFNNTDLTGPSLKRLDFQVCFDWESGSPFPSLAQDCFSTRWTGKIEPRYSGTYTFHTITDDGVRLWIDNKLIIDQWKGISMQEHSGTIGLEAGNKYDIKMEYYEGGIRAGAILEWSSADQKREVVPKSQLYCDELKTQYTISGNIKTSCTKPNDEKSNGFEVVVKGYKTSFSCVPDINGKFETLLSADNVPATIEINKQGCSTRTFIIEELVSDKEITTEGNSIVLGVGDFDGDGVITMVDIMKLAIWFNSARGDAKYQEKYDVNGDGAVNMADCVIMAKYFMAR